MCCSLDTGTSLQVIHFHHCKFAPLFFFQNPHFTCIAKHWSTVARIIIFFLIFSIMFLSHLTELRAPLSYGLFFLYSVQHLFLPIPIILSIIVRKYFNSLTCLTWELSIIKTSNVTSELTTNYFVFLDLTSSPPLLILCI